jgi:hypothetical protein
MARRLAERDSIVLEAGSHEHSLRIPIADFLRIAERRSPTSAWIDQPARTTRSPGIAIAALGLAAH